MITTFYHQPCDKYHREALIGNLLMRYPFLFRETIGESLCSRPIDLLTIGNRSHAVLFAAGFHGMEWITTLLMLRFLDDLCCTIRNGQELYGIHPAAMLNRRGLAVIPCVNPDGTEIQIHGAAAAEQYQSLVQNAANGNTSCWQANARGVDINHNFDADWDSLHQLEAENGITAPSPTRYGGTCPESEPESRAIASLCRAGHFSHALAFHSQGEEIYYGYGKPTEINCKQALALARVSGYRLSRPEGLASGGGFKDWFCQYLGKSGFTIEIGCGKNPLPVSDLDPIYDRLREMLTLAFLL